MKKKTTKRATVNIKDKNVIVFNTQEEKVKNIGRHPNDYPPYIIPDNLDFTPDEIKKIIQSKNTAESDVGIKYLIENDNFYICKKILKYHKLDNEIHRPMIERALADESSLDLLPRGIYKTTVGTICGALIEIKKNPDISILIIMNSATNAVKVLSEIKVQLMRNARWRYFIGDWYTGNQRWQANSIICGCRTQTSNKTGTIDAAGKDTKLTSQHYDLIYLDDIADENDRDSEAARDATKKVYEDIIDLLNPGGRLKIRGTRWHFGDIYNHIINKVQPQLIEKKLKTMRIEVLPVRKSDGSLRFPQMFDEEKLKELLAKKGIVSYSAQYDLNPLSGENTLFLPDNCGYFDIQKFDPNDGVCYGYLDPALGKNKKGCQAPILTAYYMHSGIYSGKILLVHTNIDIRRPSASVKLVVKNHLRYNYASFGVEDNGSQDLFLSGIDAAAEKISIELYGDPKNNKDYKPILVPIFGITNTKKKESRIEAFEKYYTTQKVLFRSDCESAPGNYMEGMNSMWQYPFETYRDFIDALECLVTRVVLGGEIRMGAG